MKYLLVVISLFAWKLFAQDQLTSKQRSAMRKDVEAHDNIQKLFLDTLDPSVVLKDLPPKFVELKDVELSTDGFETMGALYSEKTAIVNLPGFVYALEQKALGTVVGGFRGEEVLSGSTDRVIVATESLEKGKKYTILHKGHTFKGHRNMTLYVYHNMGTAVVDEVINEKQVAVLTHGSSVVRTGDILVSLIDAERKIDTSLGIRKRFAGKAKILSLVEKDLNFVGESGFVFLDKGIDDGIVLNQILDVYVDSELQSLKGQDNRVVGSIQIVDLTQIGATAYVLYSNREINVGDYASSK